MTVSGVSIFSVTMSEIIYSAFQIAEIIASGDILDADDFAIAKADLNKMTKAWQQKGIGLWLNQTVYLPLAQGQQSYALGPTGDNCTTSLGETILGAAAALGATSLTVAAITSMVSGQYIGIQLDDGTMQWTTISGTPSGSTVLLAAALTDSAALGNTIFFYTTKIYRPLEILEARLRDVNAIDTPLEVIPRQQYMDLSVKSTQGKINQVYYDQQLVNGVIYVWSTSYSVTDRIVMTVKRPLFDFVNVDDTPDFPIEWSDAIEKNLAYKISPKFHVPAQKKAELKLDAQESFDDALFGDSENYIYFCPAQGN